MRSTMGPAGTLGAGNGRADPMSTRSGTPKSASTNSAGRRAKTGGAATTGRCRRRAGQPAGPAFAGAQDHAQAPRRRHDRLRPSRLLRGARRRHRQGGPDLARDLLPLLLQQGGSPAGPGGRGRRGGGHPRHVTRPRGARRPGLARTAPVDGAILRGLAALRPRPAGLDRSGHERRRVVGPGSCRRRGRGPDPGHPHGRDGAAAGHRSPSRRRSRGGHGRAFPLPAPVRR